MIDESGKQKLFRLALDYFSQLSFQPDQIPSSETDFTKNVIFPSLSLWHKNLNMPSFILSSNGHLAPKPLSVWGMQFFPDITIEEFQSKLLAVEIKLLRDNESTGSLAKAVGQSFIYHTLGFYSSISLIMDLRTNQFHDNTLKVMDSSLNENNAKVALLRYNLKFGQLNFKSLEFLK